MKITILGAGTWGAALARVLALAGHEVTLWSAVEKEIDTKALEAGINYHEFRYREADFGNYPN